MNEKKKKIAIPLAILCGGLAIATTALIAIKARRHKIANQSQKENLLQNFKKLQKQLNELLGYKIVNEINVFHEQEVLQESLKINNKSETKVIEEETLRLKDAITLLISKIKNQINQKELEFAKFNEIKDKLQEYIKNELSKQEYEHIKQNIENELNKYTPISLESTLIEIQNATNNLIKLLNESTKEKDNIDNLNAKEQLKSSISQANQLLSQLSDNDSEIAKAKKSLDAEIKKAKQAVTSNNTASMQSAKESLDAKVSQIDKQLQQFNKDKENKFAELEQTRKNIDNFLTSEVKNNPNYSTLVNELNSAKEAKKLVNKSSNKSEIENANEALKQALEKAKAAKSQADNSNKSIKDQLNSSITNASQLLNKLSDSDRQIQSSKAALDAEIKKAKQAVTSNNTASMQSAKESLDAKVSQIDKQLQQFNKDKENKFAELEQTRNNIDNFLTSEVKNNPNYSTLVNELNSAKEAKKLVNKSSNKSEIENANEALKQALEKAKAAKSQADNSNKSIKDQLNSSITNASQLLNKLSDSDRQIQSSKAALDAEIKKAKQAVTSNNTASMQSAKESLDAKVSQIDKQLQQFNKDKENKFAELEQTRNNIDNFLTSEVKNNPNYSTLVNELNSAKEAKKLVNKSSNKSEIENANEALKQALEKAKAAKSQADNLNKSIKDQLNSSITNASQLLNKLSDSDRQIQSSKAALDAEIKKAKQAVTSNNTASMQSAKESLDAKVSQIDKQLQQFNKDKENKFAELEQTRNNIDNFLTSEVKNNPNYSTLVNELNSAKEAKKLVNKSSNKSEIENANEALKQALEKAKAAKSQADNLNKSIKDQLNSSITNASQLLNKLSDSDRQIQSSKAALDAEIKKAKQAVTSNNTASMQSAKESLDAKVSQIDKQLQQFNKDKENKFAELEQTRNNIDNFLTSEVKNNPNYSTLVNELNSAKEAKKLVNKSSNKSEIENANEALKQALEKAKAAKSQADNLNKSIKDQLNSSITNASQLLNKLSDSDRQIQSSKAALDAEIKKAKQAVTSNNTASMQSAKESLDAKVSQIDKQLQQFNKDKENKFAELEQTRNNIDNFLTSEVKNNPNYSTLVNELNSAKEAKKLVNKSSNKSEIENANEALKQALEKAKAAKSQADNLNKSIKDQLNSSITNASQLLNKLSDSDRQIQSSKAALDAEIKKAKQAVTSNNTASMQSAKESLDAKVSQIDKQLQQFNKDKENKFAELEQTRNNIDNFLTSEVKNNPNYSTLVNELNSAKEAKKLVNKSSNKSEIENANEALKQALEKAKAAKSQADNSNKSIKDQLNSSITNASQLLNKLSDSDRQIQSSKAALDAEIKKAKQAVTSNNTASMQSAKESLDAKVSQIDKQLQQFNKDKENKFAELEQTRNNIDNFLTSEVKNNPNYSTLVNELNSAKEAKKLVNKSSNKSEIENANEALKQALEKAKAAKSQADNLNKSIKDQLNSSITNASQLLNKLSDSDRQIQSSKAALDAEIKKAKQAVTSNNTASMQSAKESLDAKVSQIDKQLQQFNKDKENKFAELEQTRNNIDNFLTSEVKNNPNYSTLVNELNSAKEAKKLVNKSSNKSDIIAANQALQQALNTAKAKKSSIDNELKPLKDDLQSKIEEFGPIRNTNFSWISSKLENAKNKLAEELTKADAIKNNPSSSKQALRDSSQQVQKLGNELLKTITEELGKAETKNSNIGYRLFKLAQAEQFNNSDVDKLKNAWDERQTLISKKQKPNNQSTKDYLTQLSTEMSTQESTIKKVIVDIQAHIRNNLNIQHRSEAQKLIDNMKRFYGDKVGIESLQKWQDLMDDSVLNVDDTLKDDFNKALRVLVGDYTKNPPVSSWFINKRNRSIENYQNLRNLILVRENEILLDKAKDLDKRAEKTIKFVDENINNLGQRAKTLKQEILNAKKDLSNFTLNHQKNQFTAKEINPKISLLENKLNEINQYLLPIIKQKAVSKISEIEKNKKELEDIIRSNFYLWEKNEINKYISELTNKQVDLRSNINFERNWESIKDKLDNLNIKENVSLLKEVIINNSNAQYSINKILLTIPEFIKVAQTTRSNNLRSLSEQFKYTLLSIDNSWKEVKKILDENKTLSRENITKLNEKIKLFVDRSRELKESLRWFDNFHENISDQRIKNKLDEVRELLKNV
ncbi:hypothetical protein [Metamycoplasma hominis]|uniref:hypothetical protein n=2 Tax=Metamycoplasma hominis TaxID=2098 RepID=UPI001588A77A|nr:hypothetical protein [Metamycoplasma hominis]QKX38118.1 hypothetical protein HU156_00265 [Metamycoplasma hominis]